MNTNWDNLRYFNALARHGTLSETARQIGVSHSTVQRHINSFETELNVKLFHVSASGYQLTPAGDLLYKETDAIQQSLNSLSSRIATTENAMQGKVSITATDTIGHFLLPDILANIQTTYPQITFEITIINRLTDIQKFEADIAIRTGKEPGADLIGREVGPVNFAACASMQYLESHSLNASEAIQAAQHFIKLDSSFSAAIFHDWQPASEQKQSQIVVNGFLGAYKLCQAGFGVALLPAYILDHDTQLVSLPCPDLPTPNSLWVLSNAELRDSGRVIAVRQHLAEQLSSIFAVDKS